MSHRLKYLYESISNYIEEDSMSAAIYKKMEEQTFTDEEDFVESLEEEEVVYLDMLVAREIQYARRAEDDVRESELRGIYEMLF